MRKELAIDLGNLMPLGKVTDFGDLIHQERWLVKGRRFSIIVHWHSERDTAVADRVPGGSVSPAPKKAGTIVDLHADKQRDVSVQAGDEFGNPSTFDGTVAYAGDNPALVNVTDNGDGTANLAAVGGLGNLGSMNLTITLTPTNGGPVVERVEAVNVIAGDAETFTVVGGPETEVTPDHRQWGASHRTGSATDHAVDRPCGPVLLRRGGRAGLVAAVDVLAAAARWRCTRASEQCRDLAAQ